MIQRSLWGRKLGATYKQRFFCSLLCWICESGASISVKKAFLFLLKSPKTPFLCSSPFTWLKAELSVERFLRCLLRLRNYWWRLGWAVKMRTCRDHDWKAECAASTTEWVQRNPLRHFQRNLKISRVWGNCFFSHLWSSIPDFQHILSFWDPSFLVNL